jgi:ribosome-associated translation inhibitor RaiA
MQTISGPACCATATGNHMRISLTHRHHVPSPSIVEMIERNLRSLEPDVRIDEARVHLERRLTGDPPFQVSFHIVTPGPDIIVKTCDSTLRSAILKAIERIAEKIGLRRNKRKSTTTQQKANQEAGADDSE